MRRIIELTVATVVAAGALTVSPALAPATTAGLSYEGDYPTRAACEAAAPTSVPHQCRWKPSKGVYELWVNNS